MYRTIIKQVSAAALMAAGISAAFTAPAHAQANQEGDGGVTCTFSGTLLFTAGSTCRSGDKLYSEFTLDPSSTLVANGSSWIFSDVDPDHTYGVTGSFGTGLLKYTYKMEIIPSSIGTREFHLMKTGATTSATSTNAWTKTLTANVATLPASVSSNELSPGGESAIATFAGGITSAIFTSTLNVTSGTVTNFTDSVTQKIIEEVPGPLPILGAGVAFGFSRKLRKRIGAAA
jgi:hypothetical protein